MIDIEADCTHAGSKHTYCTVCNAILEIEEIAATGHSYGEPEWLWDGYDAANATFTCSNCDGNVTVKAVVTRKVTVDAAVGVEGEAIITATVYYDGKLYTDSITEVIPAEDGGCFLGCGSLGSGGISGDDFMIGGSLLIISIVLCIVAILKKRKAV